ncbi:uncharacterized protein LOC143768329 [Ranitomeya variabilis]|uniref:uncharacterized protein LOC143768329 n=1 Tax=Ranitomeya variabilis TaxID=490064 RepID=UPI00405710EF
MISVQTLIFFAGFWILESSAGIVIGFVNLHNCPNLPHLPNLLIVQSACLLLQSVIFYIQAKKNSALIKWFALCFLVSSTCMVCTVSYYLSRIEDILSCDKVIFFFSCVETGLAALDNLGSYIKICYFCYNRKSKRADPADDA